MCDLIINNLEAVKAEICFKGSIYKSYSANLFAY